MLKKYCTCGQVIKISDKKCDKCLQGLADKKGTDKSRYVQYDSKRDKSLNKFYKSTEWENSRRKCLESYFYLDLYEFIVNDHIVFADTVHHIVEVSEDYSKRLDQTNLIPLTAGNHKFVHGLMVRNPQNTKIFIQGIRDEFRNKYLV